MHETIFPIDAASMADHRFVAIHCWASYSWSLLDESFDLSGVLGGP
jgi:hypothetical protein